MHGVLIQLMGLVALAVVGVLLAGVWNLARPGTNSNLSQMLMRWRVGLQFLAIVIAMLALAAAR
jgi:hypothetical protein